MINKIIIKYAIYQIRSNWRQIIHFAYTLNLFYGAADNKTSNWGRISLLTGALVYMRNPI